MLIQMRGHSVKRGFQQNYSNIFLEKVKIVVGKVYLIQKAKSVKQIEIW